MEVMRRQKKNYLMSLLVTLMWWVILALIVLLVDPAILANFLLPNGYLIFFFTLFMATFFSASLILMNSRRGILMAVGVVVVGYLQLWRINNWWNILLLLGILLAIELYFWGKSDTTASNDANFE